MLFNILFQFDEGEFLLRNQADHLMQCALIESGDPSNPYSKEYGINCRSSLLDLQYFNLCSGALLPDVMHDVLEGALQYELKLLLCHCIDEGYFRLSQLNSIIEGMELGYMESDRPAPISQNTLRAGDNNLLKQKG